MPIETAKRARNRVIHSSYMYFPCSLSLNRCSLSD